MRKDIAPFEYCEIDGRPTLRLYGTKADRKVVNGDKVHIIMDAIVDGWDIDIRYAIIDGYLTIWHIADRFKKDDNGRLIIKGRIDIENSEIGGANFNSATFSGDIKFMSVTFSGKVDFYLTTFNRYVYFMSANFKDDANFIATTFNDEAIFNKTTFTNVYFISATFNSYSLFKDATFSAIAEFSHSYFRKSVDLVEANLDNIPPESFDSIGDAYVSSSIRGANCFFHRAGEGYWNKPDYSKASDSFRNAKVEYDKEGKYDEAGRMYVMEKKSIKNGATIGKKIWYQLWETSCKYGESWKRFALWLLGIIVIFALVYTPSPWGIIEFSNRPYSLDNNLWDSIHTSLYLSISTFASFGSLEPVNNIGKFAVSFELLLGYLMFGVLITLVARKMTRS